MKMYELAIFTLLAFCKSLSNISTLLLKSTSSEIENKTHSS